MRVLFVCMANSCRSQMAETWARHLFPADWEVASGGMLTYPISDKTRAVMAEVGLEMTGQDTKTYDRFDLDSFDLVVTLSRSVAQYLPGLAHPERHLRRPVADPMAVKGDPETVRAAFRRGRDEIREIVTALVRGDRDPVAPSTS